VTLELGGKSPAIVTRHADIAVAARRIAWAKFLNAGQTCIAPDYVLVDPAVHDELVRAIGSAVTDFYGSDPSTSPDLARIVNDSHFHRIEKLLDSGTAAIGGVVDADRRYIAPTVLTGVTRGDPVMGEEIFGPVLPVLTCDSIDAAIDFVNADEKPLALYVFSDRDDEVERVIGGTSSGGVCVNAALFQVSNPHLPFGGVGESGTGAYHGEFGFETFSHRRAVYERSTRVDPPLLYPPYTATKQRLLRRALTLADPRDHLARARDRVLRRG
jgi:aldehyde dehydrogenase (NAD+)